MKKLICLALICMMSTANVLAKVHDITPSWDWVRWVPEGASDLCDNGSYQDRFNFFVRPTTYVCRNGLTLNNGYTIVSDSKMTIRVR
ncbi:hypothetical protein, partial [Vibrio parahaemolyticus]|uniref:hypothetical protein n=1 Tax=Vibrio parahaemolyticus TaxID=670 RepID=UPI001BB01092